MVMMSGFRGELLLLVAGVAQGILGFNLVACFSFSTDLNYLCFDLLYVRCDRWSFVKQGLYHLSHTSSLHTVFWVNNFLVSLLLKTKYEGFLSSCLYSLQHSYGLGKYHLSK
jgi:hypothetical protein